MSLVYLSAILIKLNSHNSWPVPPTSPQYCFLCLLSDIFSLLLSELIWNLVSSLFSTSQVWLFPVKILKRKMSDDIIWVMRSWYHSPCFEILFVLFYCEKILKGEAEIAVTGLKPGPLDTRTSSALAMTKSGSGFPHPPFYSSPSLGDLGDNLQRVHQPYLPGVILPHVQLVQIFWVQIWLCH